MTGVCVVIPWRPDGQERDTALDYVLGRYRRTNPDWQVRLGGCPTGPWSKGAALMDAIRSTSAEILVLADADVWSDGLPAAVQAVRDGEPWAIPHTLVNRLDPAGTTQLLRGEQPTFFAERPYPGMPGGGLLVLPRAAYLAYPVDPRFHGWGQEDETLGRVLEAVFGPPWRGDADLIHLWHPPAPRLSRSRGNPEGWRLRRRYLKARWNPTELQALIEEARVALDAHQPAMRDPAAPDERQREDAVRPAA